MPLSYRKLARYPRSLLIDEDLFRGRTSELDLIGFLGAPTLESPASEPDPTFFWDLEWHCGLVMGMRFNQLTEDLFVRLDELDIPHALRHLGFEVRDLALLEDEEPATFATLGPPLDVGFELWAEDDGGRKTLLVGGLTERDAQCRLAEREDAEPGRRFWVTAAA